MAFFLVPVDHGWCGPLVCNNHNGRAGCSECVHFWTSCSLSFHLDSKILYFSVFTESLLCVGFTVFMLDFYMHRKALGIPVIMLPLYTQMQSHALVKKWIISSTCLSFPFEVWNLFNWLYVATCKRACVWSRWPNVAFFQHK